MKEWGLSLFNLLNGSEDKMGVATDVLSISLILVSFFWHLHSMFPPSMVMPYSRLLACHIAILVADKGGVDG